MKNALLVIGSDQWPYDCLDIITHSMYFSSIVAVASSPRICTSGSSTLPTTSAPSGYLSSYITSTTQVGSVDCPWHIRALPGQRIKVYLYIIENIVNTEYWWNFRTSTSSRLYEPWHLPVYKVLIRIYQLELFYIFIIITTIISLNLNSRLIWKTLHCEIYFNKINSW